MAALESQIAELQAGVRQALSDADYDGAAKYAQQCYAACSHVFGAKHAVTAGALNNIALVAKEQGNDAKALEFYQAALDCFLALPTHGEHHASTAATIANMGLLWRRRAQGATGMDREAHLSTALELLKRAQAARTAALHPTAPIVAVTRMHVGNVLRLQRRFKEALAELQEAIRVLEAKPGKEHRVYGTVMNYLGLALKDAGQLTEAEDAYRVALAQRTHSFGPDHPETLVVQFNLAELLSAQGRESEALDLQTHIAAQASPTDLEAGAEAPEPAGAEQLSPLSEQVDAAPRAATQREIRLDGSGPSAFRAAAPPGTQDEAAEAEAQITTRKPRRRPRRVFIPAVPPSSAQQPGDPWAVLSSGDR